MQLLVENKRNLDLRHALELAAAVQPIKVDASMIDEVSYDHRKFIISVIGLLRSCWQFCFTLYLYGS